MKTTFLLCLVVSLMDCSRGPTPNPAPGPGSSPSNGMDSPIFISDGSTHLRHKGAKGDFQITDSGSSVEAIVNDSGFQVGKGECLNGVLPADCPMDFRKVLVQGWTMQVFDDTNTLVMTLVSSMSNSAEIDTTFSVANVFTSSDNSGDTTDASKKVGSDVGTAPNVNNFKSATFTNGGGGKPETIPCNSSPCKLKINYTHP